MKLLTLLTVFAAASVSTASPSSFKSQISCIGLNNRRCDNSTINYTCCPPLRCGSDSVCSFQEKYWIIGG
ncbi:hypothetical protein BJY04DRAFT_24604 [Aspergillus karnatakaensis]|uniref:uncharacterized protein n=1 Tax=Aspergillus karnatakaensis TaxID=1810916 RepID=UPI003CCE058F